MSASSMSASATTGRPRGEAGFTLLELLVAMTVMAILVTALGGSLRFGLRAWEAGQEAADRLEAPAAVQAFLRRQIEQAYPLAAGGAEVPLVRFEGDVRRLRFLGTLPPRIGMPGLADMVLTYESDGLRTGRLVMAWQPLDRPGRAPESRTLLDGVASLDFAYFGGETRTAPPEWRASWREAGFLPALVRLRIRFPDGRVWPDLIVAPAITIDSLLD